MKVRYEIGPNFGQTDHVQRHPVVDIFLKLGFLSLAEDDPVPVQPSPFPKRGYAIARVGYESKPIIAFFDGHGGTTYYKGDQAPSDCPVEVVNQYRQLVGPTPDQLEAAHEKAQRERMLLEQKSTNNGDIAAYLAKLGHTEGL